MAACDLRIAFDERGKTYVDGEPISGTVTVVVAEKDVKCKALVISTNWQTHGRGNIDRLDVASTEVFSGTWQAGQTYTYPFSLETGVWPPTYFGTLMNVTHSVKARAKIPWAFDAKASSEFPVACQRSQADVEQEQAQKSNSIILWIIGAVLLVVFAFAALFLVPFLLIIGALSWFFLSYLPKSITGPVECSVTPLTSRPGEKLTGKICFTPKRNSKINGVFAKLVCEEVVVSGSGSNRTTHRHEVHSQKIELVEPGNLTAGKKYDLDFDIPIPPNAPPSMDLRDNDLKWKAELRVDIPRWPDFAKSFSVLVEPRQDVDGLAEQVENSGNLGEAEEWYLEVLKQLKSTARDPENLRLVLEAIEGHRFNVRLRLKERVARPVEAEGIHGGVWMKAWDDRANQSYLLHSDEEGVFREQQEFGGTIRLVAYRDQSSIAIAQVS